MGSQEPRRNSHQSRRFAVKPETDKSTQPVNEGLRERAETMSNEELLQELCDTLQSVGTYKGPRTSAEVTKIMRSVYLQTEILVRMDKASIIQQDTRRNVIGECQDWLKDRGQPELGSAIRELAKEK
jgi:hypothetical protein